MAVDLETTNVTRYLNYEGLVHYDEKLKETFAKQIEVPKIATVDKPGIVKPDGTTITVLDDGTISVNNLSGYVKKTELVDIANTEIDEMFNQGEKQSSAVVEIQTEGEYLGLKYAELGTFTIDGLSIYGVSKNGTAIGWNGEGQDKTGYFVGLKFTNVKKVKTPTHPDGIDIPEGDNDMLLCIGERYPTLPYIEVVDNEGSTDKYNIRIIAEGAKKYVSRDNLQSFKLKSDFLYAKKSESISKSDLDEYAKKTDVSSIYKPKGSIEFESLEGLNIAENVGDVYNVMDQFTTTDDFIEGADAIYPAGTNVVIVESDGEYKFDVLSGVVDLSSYMKTADIAAIPLEDIDILFSKM